MATRISAQQAAVSTILSPATPVISSPWMVRTIRMNVVESSIWPSTSPVPGWTYTEIPGAKGSDGSPAAVTMRVVRSGACGGMTLSKVEPGRAARAAWIWLLSGSAEATGEDRVRTSA